MVKKNIEKRVAKTVKNALDVVLRTEANSTSCLIMHEPKAPKELSKFKK
ncbi:cyclic lactone autoinducer peptide [Anaerobutyricum soehngenii]|nr:cyclic lactone autoinducer peptide [Anaerobutyricum soehngenii]MBU5416400.1 cyclic lactone autoinducer peptide [Anaerobutyricum soehngenii]